MAGMMDGVSKLWVVETQGRGLAIQGYKDEFEASSALLYRLWTQVESEHLKTRIRKLAEDVCAQLDHDLNAKKV